MNYKVIEMIFTDKTKEGKELINKWWNPFFMLHLRIIGLEAWDEEIWVSRYYTRDEHLKLEEKILIGNIYMIEIKQSWIYYNIQNILNDKNEIII